MCCLVKHSPQRQLCASSKASTHLQVAEQAPSLDGVFMIANGKLVEDYSDKIVKSGREQPDGAEYVLHNPEFGVKTWGYVYET